MAASSQTESDPEGSPLLGLMLGEGGLDYDLDVDMLHEVGSDGEVLAYIMLMEFGDMRQYVREAPSRNQRFVIEDRCLKLEGRGMFGTELGETSYDASDFVDFPSGPCPLGQAAVGPAGLVYGTPQGEYICVRVESGSICRDCWVADGAWHEKSTIRVTYVAEASMGRVARGDRATFTARTLITYRASPSPEQLGYTEWTMPSLP